MNMSFLGMSRRSSRRSTSSRIVILLIMMLILGNTIAMGVRERTHEYGVLRAIGFLPRHVRHVRPRRGAWCIGLARRRRSASRSRTRSSTRAWAASSRRTWAGFFPYFRVDAQRRRRSPSALAVVLAPWPPLHSGRIRPRSCTSSTRCGGWAEDAMIPISYNLRSLTVRKTTTHRHRARHRARRLRARRRR